MNCKQPIQINVSTESIVESKRLHEKCGAPRSGNGEVLNTLLTYSRCGELAQTCLQKYRDRELGEETNIPNVINTVWKQINPSP